MLFGKAMSPCARTNSQLLIKGGATSTFSNSVRPGKKMACRRSLVSDRMERFDTIIVHIVAGASLLRIDMICYSQLKKSHFVSLSQA